MFEMKMDKRCNFLRLITITVSAVCFLVSSCGRRSAVEMPGDDAESEKEVISEAVVAPVVVGTENNVQAVSNKVERARLLVWSR